MLRLLLLSWVFVLAILVSGVLPYPGDEPSDPSGDPSTHNTEYYKTLLGDSKKAVVVSRSLQNNAKTLARRMPVGNQHHEIPCDILFTNRSPNWEDSNPSMCKVQLSCTGLPNTYHCAINKKLAKKSLTLRYCGPEANFASIDTCEDSLLAIRPVEDTEDETTAFHTLRIGASDNAQVKILVTGSKKRIDPAPVDSELLVPCNKLAAAQKGIRGNPTGCIVNLACGGDPGAYKCLLRNESPRYGQALHYCGSPELDKDRFAQCGDDVLVPSQNLRYKTTIELEGKAQEVALTLHVKKEWIRGRALAVTRQVSNEVEVPCDKLWSRANLREAPDPDDCVVELSCAGEQYPMKCLTKKGKGANLSYCSFKPFENVEHCSAKHLGIIQGDCDGNEDDEDEEMPDAPAVELQAGDYVVNLRSGQTQSESQGFLEIYPGMMTLMQIHRQGAFNAERKDPKCSELPGSAAGHRKPTDGCQVEISCSDGSGANVESKYITCRLNQEGDFQEVDQCQHVSRELPPCDIN